MPVPWFVIAQDALSEYRNWPISSKSAVHPQNHVCIYNQEMEHVYAFG